MTVTKDQVRGLVVGIPDSFDLVPVIQLAANMRAEYLEDKEELTEGMKDQIELFIAAHFTVNAVHHGGLVRSVMGEAAETYREIHSRESGLYGTIWGQQAIALDSSGTLASISTGSQRAEFRVI